MSRDCFFPLCCKQAFRFQFAFQLFIGLHQTADTFFNQHIRVQLVHPVPLVDADMTDGQNSVSVDRIFYQLPGLTLEHDTFQHAVFIF